MLISVDMCVCVSILRLAKHSVHTTLCWMRSNEWILNCKIFQACVAFCMRDARPRNDDIRDVVVVVGRSAVPHCRQPQEKHFFSTETANPHCNLHIIHECSFLCCVARCICNIYGACWRPESPRQSRCHQRCMSSCGWMDLAVLDAYISQLTKLHVAGETVSTNVSRAMWSNFVQYNKFSREFN